MPITVSGTLPEVLSLKMERSIFGDYKAVIFLKTFFNLSLNFVIRSSQSEPQSALGCVFADSIELLYQLQRI